MKIIDSFREYYHRSRFERAINLISAYKGHIPAGENLDLGIGRPCESMGDGEFLKMMRGIGLDLKPVKVEFPFVVGDMTELPFKSKRFSVVSALEALEHLEDIDLALREISRVMRDDSVFIVSTPTNNIIWRFFWPLWENTFGGMWRDAHKCSLNQKQWRAVILRHFDIIETQLHWGVISFFLLRKHKGTAN